MNLTSAQELTAALRKAQESLQYAHACINHARQIISGNSENDLALPPNTDAALRAITLAVTQYRIALQSRQVQRG